MQKKILNIFTLTVIVLLIGCTVASFAIRAITQPKVEVVCPTEYWMHVGVNNGDTFYTIPAEAVMVETLSYIDDDGEEVFYDKYYVYITEMTLGLFGELYDAARMDVKIFEPDPKRFKARAKLYCYSDREHMDEPIPWDWSFFENESVVFLADDGSIYSWNKVIVTGLDRVEEGTRVRLLTPERRAYEMHIAGKLHKRVRKTRT